MNNRLRKLLTIFTLLISVAASAQTVTDWMKDGLRMRDFFVGVSAGSGGNLDERIRFQSEFSPVDTFKVNAHLYGHSDWFMNSGMSLHNTWSENQELKKYYDIKDYRNKFYNDVLGIDYVHAFKHGGTFNISAQYEGHRYNMQQVNDSMFANCPDRQHDHTGYARVSLDQLSLGRATLSLMADYTFFRKKYHLNTPTMYDERVTHAEVGLEYQLNDVMSLGFESGYLRSWYNPGKLTGVWELDCSPHVAWRTDKLEAQLGVFLCEVPRIAPDCYITYHANKHNDWMLTVEGGESQLDFHIINALNPYWQVSSNIEKHALGSSFSPVRATAGYRFHHTGFVVEAALGYERKLDNPVFTNLAVNDYGCIINEWNLANTHHAHVKADASYTYLDYIDIKMHHQFNYWHNTLSAGSETGKYVRELTRPVLDIDWRFRFKIYTGIHFGFSMAYRTYQNQDDGYHRPNQFTIGASCRFNLGQRLPFSLYVRGENIFNNIYDAYYGYRAQHSNALIGLTFSF